MQCHWLRDYHFDGLRLDAIHAYFDRSAVTFLENLSSEVDSLEASLGRHLVLIAESDLNDPRVVTCREAGGLGIDAQWSDDFHHALHSVLTGETTGYYKDFGSLRHLATALREGYVYAGDYSPSSRARRTAGAILIFPVIAFSAIRKITIRPAIEPPATGSAIWSRQAVRKSPRRWFSPRPLCPCFFRAKNLAPPRHFNISPITRTNVWAKACPNGRRNEFAAFGWNPEQVPDPQDLATFERSKLRWEEIQSEPHAALLAWYRKLIAFRRSQPSLTDGRLDRVDVTFDEHAGWLVMKRGPVEVACNFGADWQAIPITHTAGRNLFRTGVARSPGIDRAARRFGSHSLLTSLHLRQGLPCGLKIRVDPQRRLKFRARLRQADASEQAPRPGSCEARHRPPDNAALRDSAQPPARTAPAFAN